MTERGLIEWVETYPPRSFATVSVAAGFNKVLQVEDAEVFLLPDGVDAGEVLIDGVVHTYTAVFDSDDEDVPSTITLPSLNVAVDVGDPIELYPSEPTTWAGVSIAGDDDGDIMTARVDHALLGYTALADGPRDPEDRELAILEYREDTELVLVGIDGAVAMLDAGALDPETTVPDATLADTQMKADLDAAAAAIGDAASNASTALSNAAAAVSAADAASDVADAAQLAANQAAADALAASGLAGSKGKVIFSSSAPAAGDQVSQNLWVDTTGGANTPKRWNGSAWIAVTDKVATDAASAAASAAGVAATAASNASTALTTANGKNKIVFSAAAASGTAYVDGDVWFQKSGGLIVGQWEFVSGAWASRTIDNALIANLNAGKITAGNLDAGAVTIHTAATGSRVELKSTGLIGYDGAGVAKTVIDATTGKITAVDGTFTGAVTATSGTFTGVVNATDGNFIGDITTDTANINGTMNVNSKGSIGVGSQITISQPTNVGGVLGGGIVIRNAAGEVVARLHPDGNYLDGELKAQDITVIDALRLTGASSAIASSAKLTLENGVANPSAPTIDYDAIRTSWPAIPDGYVERGITWDSTTPAGVGQWYQLLWRSSNQRAYVRTISTAGVPSTVGAAFDLPAFAGSSPTQAAVASIVLLGGNIFICARNAFNEWNAVKYNTSGARLAETILNVAGGTAFPAIGTDGTSIYTVGQLRGSDPAIQRWNTSLGHLDDARVSLTGIPDATNLRGFGFSSFDRGTPLVQLTTSAGNVYHFTPATFVDYPGEPTLARATSHDFTIDAGAWLGYQSSGSPTGFYSSKSDAKLARYSSYFPTAGEKWWAQYADTAPSKTTAVSAESAGVAVPARRFATVNLNPAPTGVTGADVFVGYGTTTPGTTKKKRTETLTGRTMVLTAGKVTGTDVMPSTNTMGGSPAEIKDGFGNSWKGDGTVVLPGLAAIVDSGWVDCPAASGGIFTSTVQVRKIGNMVISRGGVIRATSFSTSVTSAAIIPVGYRPPITHPFAPGPPSTAVGVRGQITTLGEIQIAMSAASASNIACATTWFVDA